MAELTGLAYNASIRELGPVQLNIPRDFFYVQNTFTVPRPQTIEATAGGETSLQRAAELI